MKEVIFYSVMALSSLFILGYSVHMFVGGLVSPVTEKWLIIGACLIGVSVIGYMAWDVIQRRRKHRGLGTGD